MATAHGSDTILTVATKDISPYCKTSTLERSAKTHDTTGYGVDDEVHDPGLKSGTFTVGGTYDNTVLVGPRIALMPLLGTKVPIVRKLEGTGSGKPNDSFNAVLEKYVETSPHDDYVTWSADFKISGPVNVTPQA